MTMVVQDQGRRIRIVAALKTHVNLIQGKRVVPAVDGLPNQGQIHFIPITGQLNDPGFVDFPLIMPEKNALDLGHGQRARRSMVPV